MDSFTAAFGPIFTAVAGAALAWLFLRGREPAERNRKPQVDPAAQRDRFYRRSFEASPVGLGVMTPNGRWLRFNERLRVLLGYTREELNNLTLRELTHSDDRKVEATHIRKLMRREIGSYSLEKRLLCKDREHRRFEVSMVRFEEEGGTLDLWQCVVSPAAAETRDDQAEENGKLGGILGPVSDLSYVWYDDQGIIEEWNHGAERIFGHTAGEIVGRSRTTLYREADVWEQKPLNDLKVAIATGRLECDDVRVGRDGMEINLRITIIPDVVEGRVVGFVELAREIEQARGVDQYRQAYERLKSISEERMRSLQTEIAALRSEADASTRREQSFNAEMENVRIEAKKQLAELRILTDAFRKELDRRKALERELQAALDEREALGHRMLEMQKRQPLVEKELVDLAAPTEMHWTPIGSVNLDEVLRDLARQKKTGALVATCDTIDKRIFIENGLIYSSTSNDPSMLLGEVLLREKVISKADHERALEVHHETGIALGRILVLTGVLDEKSLEAAMQLKTKKDVLDLLAWTDGQLVFLEGEPRPIQLVPVRLEVEPILSERVLVDEDIGEITLVAASDATTPVDLDATLPAAVAPEGVADAADQSPEGADERHVALPEQEAESEVGAAEPGEDLVQFVASRAKRSTKFHRVDCRQAKKIDRAKRIEFRTREEAIARGLEPCSKCLG
jgi:PAS domain S-box-containing protein